MSDSEKPIYEVTEVTVEILEREPPILVVKAEGKVRSGGWTDAALLRRVYIIPPHDGIQEYDFVATPPSGASTEAIEEVRAVDSWHNPADWVRGVRVYAETNKLEKPAQVRSSAA